MCRCADGESANAQLPSLVPASNDDAPESACVPAAKVSTNDQNDELHVAWGGMPWKALTRVQTRLQLEINAMMGVAGVPGGAVSTSLFFLADPKDRANHIAKYTKNIPCMIKSMAVAVPGWVFVCFYDDTVPASMITLIKGVAAAANVPEIMIRMPQVSEGRAGCFWRFLAADLFEIVYFRDIELPFQATDIAVLADFKQRPELAGYTHLIHQRTWTQQRVVMAGLFMCKKALRMTEAINHWRYWHPYGADEVFLTYGLHATIGDGDGSHGASRRFVVYTDPSTRASAHAMGNAGGLNETYVDIAIPFDVKAAGGACP